MSTQKKGTVKWFNDEKGYGFIKPDGGGEDVFVHIKDVEASKMRILKQGQTVAYSLQEQDGGKVKAVKLSLIEKEAA